MAHQGGRRCACGPNINSAVVTAIHLAANPVSQMTGIVTFLTEVELNRGEPEVFVAAARGPDMHLLSYKTGAGIVGSGAGLTWHAARGAAVGECLERYSSAIVHADDLLVGSHEVLAQDGLSAHKPADWALFEESQDIPYPAFTGNLPIAWSEGWDLVTNKSVFLPACFVHVSSSSVLRGSGASILGPAVSTGCACAVSKDEAVFKGLCELIERDAFMIVWRSRLPIREVIIDKGTLLHDVYASRFARPALEYRIWQTTLDFSLPSFFGILFDHRGPAIRMVAGGAANPDAEQAVQKTLCELIQGLTWLEYMGPLARGISSDFNSIHTFTDRALYYASHQVPDAFSFLMHDCEPVALSSIASTRAPIAETLPSLIGEVAAKGFRPAAIDLTTHDVRECGYFVTRVMVPGLETMEGDHRLQMLGGSRWRRVPVDLGYLKTAPTRAEVNPYPHPYP